MLISEIFYSIQGEGELTGIPSVFIRTSGCNLRCRWCDTPYASWNPEGEDMSVDRILEEVKKHSAHHCVLTGGEPMIAKGIRELASALRGEGYHITIETAGTISPDGIACDLASISPKLRHSLPAEGSIERGWIQRHEQLRIQYPVLKNWISAYNYQLKFVYSDRGDAVEIDSILLAIGHPVSLSKILLMPEAIHESSLNIRQKEVLDLCLKKGYRYCDRLHIRIFGNKRGT